MDYPPMIPLAVRPDLERAAAILTGGGCQAVFLFGSAAHGAMHAGSDIDLAVKGCPPERFFHLFGRLLSELEHPVDLIDLDTADPFVEWLLTSGEMVPLADVAQTNN